MKKKVSLLLCLALTAAFVFCACAAPGDSGKKGVHSVETEAGQLPENVNSLTEEQVSTLLDKAYATLGEETLPPMVMHMPLDLSDGDMVAFAAGLTDVSGVDGVILSESGISSVAYSLVYVRVAEGADSDAIQKAVLEGVNPAKWICVCADKVLSVKLGTDVLVVMGSEGRAEAVLNAVTETAKGVFTTIGETVEK